MRATTIFDPGLRHLLQPLLSLRHAHLRPLDAVTVGAGLVCLEYGQPGACEPGCGGLEDALLTVHRAGLWVGDVRAAVGLDDVGRVVLAGVGSSWDLSDPFAGHPATRGEPGLRVPWRQRADLAQVSRLAPQVRLCA